jgi:GT2 family glycosyltransferase
MKESLTVGIIAHNEEHRILGCLESLQILKNQVQGIFVILVDNNSSDLTVPISEKHLIENKLNYKIIERDQNNLAEARNDILQSAVTRWVYMLDADCRLDLTTWPCLVETWKSDSKIAAYGGSQKFTLNHEILILLEEMRKSYWGHFGSAQMRSSGSVQTIEHVSTTHVLYDKLALETIGGFNPILNRSAEDLDLSLRLRKAGFELQFSPHSFLWHEQADSWKNWAQKAFRNGIWQTRLIAHNFDILKTRRPWPGLLLLLIPLLPPKIVIFFSAVYFGCILFLSIRSKLSFKSKFKLMGLFAMTHFLYATGEMVGIFLAIKDLVAVKTLPISTKS